MYKMGAICSRCVSRTSCWPNLKARSWPCRVNGESTDDHHHVLLLAAAYYYLLPPLLFLLPPTASRVT